MKEKSFRLKSWIDLQKHIKNQLIEFESTVSYDHIVMKEASPKKDRMFILTKTAEDISIFLIERLRMPKQAYKNGPKKDISL